MMSIDELPTIDDIDFGPGERASAAAGRQRRWRRLNPERYRLRSRIERHRYRARRHGLKEHFTLEEWLALLHFYNNRCPCCKRSDVGMTIDHVVPFERGGDNTIDNVQPLCEFCNKAKGMKTIDYRPHSKGAAV